MAHRIAEITGTRDENGIVTISQSWWVEDLSEIFAGGEREIRFKGATLPEKSRSFSLWEKDSIENGYRVTITYEGPDWSMSERSMHTYGYDSEFSEQPIETHPQLKVLIDKHNGEIVTISPTEKRLVFPLEFDEAQKKGQPWAKSDSAEAAKANPNFGYRSYPCYESVWTHTFVTRELPEDLLSRVGTVVDSPPGKPPTPKGRNWMIMTPEIQIFRANTGYRVTNRYKLSGPGGWPPVLTNLAQI
ncbi:MAG TPA: hypothetical protein PLA50_10460 [Bacteroidia bacterium]|nr:hypothetical protein [Bacteroidia bacterium]